MTDYPPQGPGYGQGGGAGWDQGGYGRQPGHGQGGYGQGGYGQPTWGAPPVPPDNNRRNAIIAGVVAVVVLAGGIGALVLFSGKSKNDDQARGSGSPTPSVSRSADFRSGTTDPTDSIPDPTYSPPPATPDPSYATTTVPSYIRESATLTGSRYFTELRNHSLDGIKQLVCSGVPVSLTQSTVDSVTLAYASTTADQSGSTATVEGVVRTAADRFEIIVTVRQEGDGWCISKTQDK